MPSKSSMAAMVSFLIQRVSPQLVLASIHQSVSKDSSSLPIFHHLPVNILINQVYFFLLIMILFSLLTFSSNFLNLRYLSQIQFIPLHSFTHIVFKLVQISFPIERLMNKIGVIASFKEGIYSIQFYSLVTEGFLVEVIIFLSYQNSRDC